MPQPKKPVTVTLQFESTHDADGFIYWWTQNGGQEHSNYRTLQPETYKKSSGISYLIRSKQLVLKKVV